MAGWQAQLPVGRGAPALGSHGAPAGQLRVPGRSAAVRWPGQPAWMVAAIFANTGKNLPGRSVVKVV